MNAPTNLALGRALEHFKARRMQEVLACTAEALDANPSEASAWYLRGAALHTLQCHREAVDACRRALDLGMDMAELYLCLGTSLWLSGHTAEAIPVLEDAVDRKPALAAAHLTLGTALRDNGRFEEAVPAFRKAVELDLNLAAGHQGLGLALMGLGKFSEAVQAFKWALRLPGDHHGARTNMGICLTHLDRHEEAVASLRAALTLKDDPSTRISLSNALKGAGQVGEAIEHLRAVLDIDPEFAPAHNNLGTAMQAQGLMESAADCYRAAIDIDPTRSRSLSNYLFAQHFMEGVTEAELAKAHAEWEERYADPLRDTWPDTPRAPVDAARPLRLGFVSPDMCRHPVGWLMVRVLEGLRGKAELLVYSDRGGKDDLTARMMTSTTQWRDVHGVPDEVLAKRIRNDRVDVLFDLAGHTGGGRLLTFARKPAPLQVTWIGYEGTTGLKAMDGLIADRHVVPPGSEVHYVERVLRMPDGYVCYNPPPEAPEVGPLPCLESGHVTFGSFSNPSKITSQVVTTWAEVLRGVPGSRMILKYRGLHDAATRKRFEKLFAAEGIELDRLDFEGATPHPAALAAYNRVDIALDPFPFSGSLTSLEALWMGVPVVTFPGKSFASRHTVSHLSTIGLTEPIAADIPGYVERAVSLASDRTWLTSCRAGLRDKMSASPLMDGERFATALLELLRTL